MFFLELQKYNKKASWQNKMSDRPFFCVLVPEYVTEADTPISHLKLSRLECVPVWTYFCNGCNKILYLQLKLTLTLKLRDDNMIPYLKLKLTLRLKLRDDSDTHR